MCRKFYIQLHPLISIKLHHYILKGPSPQESSAGNSSQGKIPTHRFLYKFEGMLISKYYQCYPGNLFSLRLSRQNFLNLMRLFTLLPLSRILLLKHFRYYSEIWRLLINFSNKCEEIYKNMHISTIFRIKILLSL